MSMLAEYIKKRDKQNLDLQFELLSLIKKYNKYRNSFLFVYATAFKSNPEARMTMDDYFIIHDMLRSVSSNKLDFYIESPGGSGEAAEEIVRCLRSKFSEVSFVISGEAKSAGTILVMSGDEIYMTDSGSLGPVDAQVKIGRGVVSAYDYLEWVDITRREAQKYNRLNPVDATMIAQISPGELQGVHHSLNFAKDLIKEWLPKYKFKNWTKTETRQIQVTDKNKIDRANVVASELVNHSKFRSHGRSLKIKDFESLLKINRIDDDPDFADVVYRIQTVISLIFQSSPVYKIFATQDEKIFRSGLLRENIQSRPIKMGNIPSGVDAMVIEFTCPSCSEKLTAYGKTVANPQIDKDMAKKGFFSIKNSLIKCKKCAFQIDLTGIRNNVENQTGKKFV